MELTNELEEIRSQTEALLREKGRLSPQQIAHRLGKEVGTVEVVMKAMYADGVIRPIYVYEIVPEGERQSRKC